MDRYYHFDPRTDKKPPNTENLLRGVQSLHRDSMWAKLLRFMYEDYDISPERKEVLCVICENLKEPLAK